MAVHFYSADTRVPAFPRKKTKSFVQDIFIIEGKQLANLSFVFCTDGFLLNINQRFLNHDYYTDIITFDISENESETIGEIYISIDRVRDNAKQLGQATSKELLRVIFHGALHLCGYKDKSTPQQTIMRNKEDFYLSKFHK